MHPLSAASEATLIGIPFAWTPRARSETLVGNIPGELALFAMTSLICYVDGEMPTLRLVLLSCFYRNWTLSAINVSNRIGIIQIGPEFLMMNNLSLSNVARTLANRAAFVAPGTAGKHPLRPIACFCLSLDKAVPQRGLKR